MKPTITWILVADGGHASLFESEGWGKGLHPVGPGHLEGDLRKSREIASDKPGRAFDSASVHRSAMVPHTDPHRFAKAQFAHDLARLLNRGAVEHAYDRLVICAPPQALGDLRASLDSHAKERVAAEVHKDFTHLKMADLEARLAEVVPI